MTKILSVLLLLMVILSSCGKSSVTEITQNKTLFYRISETSVSGDVKKTDVRRVDLEVSYLSAKDGDEHGGGHGEGDDDDDDDDDSDSTCYPLPIDISSFNVRSPYKGVVEIRWESSQEENTSYYSVERSEDAKSWKEVNRVLPDKGFYIVIDRF